MGGGISIHCDFSIFSSNGERVKKKILKIPPVTLFCAKSVLKIWFFEEICNGMVIHVLSSKVIKSKSEFYQKSGKSFRPLFQIFAGEPLKSYFWDLYHVFYLPKNFVSLYSTLTSPSGLFPASPTYIRCVGEISSDLYHHQNGLANSNCCVPLIIVGFPRW